MSQQQQQPQEIQQTVSAPSTIHISTKPLPTETGTQHVTFVLSTNPTPEQHAHLSTFQPPAPSNPNPYIPKQPHLTPTGQSVFNGHVNGIIAELKHEAKGKSHLGPNPHSSTNLQPTGNIGIPNTGNESSTSQNGTSDTIEQHNLQNTSGPRSTANGPLHTLSYGTLYSFLNDLSARETALAQCRETSARRALEHLIQHFDILRRRECKLERARETFDQAIRSCQDEGLGDTLQSYYSQFHPPSRRSEERPVSQRSRNDQGVRRRDREDNRVFTSLPPQQRSIWPNASRQEIR